MAINEPGKSVPGITGYNYDFVHKNTSALPTVSS